MDNKSNGKLIALAIGGAAIMGALFLGVSFLTGYELPASSFSPYLLPLKSFMGWFLLIFCASLIIMGLGKMSGAISDKWFLSFPLSIMLIVAVMFFSLRLYWEKGRTTTLEGKYIRTVEDLNSFLAAPTEGVAKVAVPDGFDFDAAKQLTDSKCNKCHTLDSVQDALRTKFKKTGTVEVVVKRMQEFPGSGITPDEVTPITIWISEKF